MCVCARHHRAKMPRGTYVCRPAGIHSVDLANAVLLSSWTRQPVNLPLDGALYERALNDKIAASKPKAPPAVEAVADLAKSVT